MKGIIFAIQEVGFEDVKMNYVLNCLGLRHESLGKWPW